MKIDEHAFFLWPNVCGTQFKKTHSVHERMHLFCALRTSEPSPTSCCSSHRQLRGFCSKVRYKHNSADYCAVQALVPSTQTKQHYDLLKLLFWSCQTFSNTNCNIYVRHTITTSRFATHICYQTMLNTSSVT